MTKLGRLNQNIMPDIINKPNYPVTSRNMRLRGAHVPIVSIATLDSCYDGGFIY